MGRVPDTAIEGSYQETKPLEDAVPVVEDSAAAPEEMAVENKSEAKYIDIVDEDDKSLLEGEIFDQVFANGKKAPVDEDSSDEREWKVGEPEKEKELAAV